MTMTTKHPLQLLIERNESDLASEMRSYSGRCMYGKDCLALSGDFNYIISNLMATALYEGEHFTPSDKDEIISALSAVRSDSMGRGTVVYFPTVEFVAEEDAEAEEEESDED
jgi:hypothetical protein